ncbi:MAG: hypothetical protein HQK86_15150 [Nitrospinae bacterium]|nr:hypothetical protein [Nitrospinota bacterium]
MPDEKDSGYWLAKSAEHWKNGEFPQSLDSATRAIELNPKLVKAYNYRGAAKYNLRGYEGVIIPKTEVRQDCFVALLLAMTNCGAFIVIAALRQVQGKLREAIWPNFGFRDKYSVRIGIDYRQTSKVKSEGSDMPGAFELKSLEGIHPVWLVDWIK